MSHSGTISLPTIPAEEDDVDHFLKIYQQLNGTNLHLLKEIYTTDVHFIDPAHELHGLDSLTAYFKSLYENVSHVAFEFGEICRQQNSAFVSWQMQLQHPRLNGNRTIVVPGVSLIHFTQENKVCFHRDFFDLGAMLYEQLPLLGRIVAAIKRRLGS